MPSDWHADDCCSAKSDTLERLAYQADQRRMLVIALAINADVRDRVRRARRTVARYGKRVRANRPRLSRAGWRGGNRHG